MTAARKLNRKNILSSSKHHVEVQPCLCLLISGCVQEDVVSRSFVSARNIMDYSDGWYNSYVSMRFLSKFSVDSPVVNSSQLPTFHEIEDDHLSKSENPHLPISVRKLLLDLCLAFGTLHWK
jgi:hypothetical protein